MVCPETSGSREGLLGLAWANDAIMEIIYFGLGALLGALSINLHDSLIVVVGALFWKQWRRLWAFLLLPLLFSWGRRKGLHDRVNGGKAGFMSEATALFLRIMKRIC